jgi:hypothetical protein
MLLSKPNQEAFWKHVSKEVGETSSLYMVHMYGTYVATCIKYRILFSWYFVTLLHKIMCLCSE